MRRRQRKKDHLIHSPFSPSSLYGASPQDVGKPVCVQRYVSSESIVSVTLNKKTRQNVLITKKIQGKTNVIEKSGKGSMVMVTVSSTVHVDRKPPVYKDSPIETMLRCVGCSPLFLSLFFRRMVINFRVYLVELVSSLLCQVFAPKLPKRRRIVIFGYTGGDW